MERGHPFYTEELDERRAEQRRLLREVDSSVVKRIGWACNVIVQPDDTTPLVEVELRDLADEERGRVGADLLAEMRLAEVAEPVATLLATHINGMRFQAGAGPMRPDVTQVRTRYADAQQTDPLAGLDDDPRAAALTRMILFLIWADEHADDEYRDPRVRDPKEPRR